MNNIRKDFPHREILMKELLGSIVSFIARSGVSQQEIQQVFKERMEGAFTKTGRAKSRARVGVRIGCDTIAGAVLRAWHRLPEFIDSQTHPRPLRVDGPGPSISSLLDVVGPNEDPQRVLAAMRAAGLVRVVRGGAYVPVKRAATIAAPNPLAVDHVAKTVLRLVETASRNMSGSKRRLTLIERYAHVPDLDTEQVEAFATFSRHQGQACLDAVEDWLEARQVRGAGGKASQGLNAGVHVFAFVEESASTRQPRARRRPSPRLTSPREARV